MIQNIDHVGKEEWEVEDQNRELVFRLQNLIVVIFFKKRNLKILIITHIHVI